MNEIPLKQWIAEESQRSGKSERTVETRVKLGLYPNLKLRRVNRRVVFVVLSSEPTMDTPTERESELGLAIAAAYADFDNNGGLAPVAEVLRLVRNHVAEEVADQAAGLHRENARLREAVVRRAAREMGLR